MKKLLALTLTTSISVFMVATANAGGDKVKNPWQPVDPDVDVCTAFLPAGLELDDCQELASTTSGKTYLCEVLDQYVVVCPDEK